MTPSIRAQRGNSMKVSQIGQIVDQTSSYASYSTDFNASALKNTWTDKSEDFYSFPWTLYSTSATGFAGTESISWRDTPLAMIKNHAEIGTDACTVNFSQENNVFAQRSIELVGQVTVSGLNGLGEIGLFIDDAPSPATGAGYGLGANNALIQRQEFFQTTATYHSGSPSTNGLTAGANGYWSGAASIRGKYLSGWREKAGIKKYGFIHHFDFVGLNGTNFPFFIPASSLGTTTPAFKVGSPQQSAIIYWHRRLEFSEEQEKAMLADIERPIGYSTYVLAGGNFLANAVAQNSLVEINISQGTIDPSYVMFYGNPSNSYNTTSWVSPMVTTSTFSTIQCQLDQQYTQAFPFNTTDLQWNSYLECLRHYNTDVNSPAINYSLWVENPIFKVLFKRQSLHQGESPLVSRQLTLTLNRSDANSTDMYCFIFYTQAVQFQRQGDGSYRVIQNIRLLDPKDNRELVR